MVQIKKKKEIIQCLYDPTFFADSLKLVLEALNKARMSNLYLKLVLAA